MPDCIYPRPTRWRAASTDFLEAEPCVRAVVTRGLAFDVLYYQGFHPRCPLDVLVADEDEARTMRQGAWAAPNESPVSALDGIHDAYVAMLLPGDADALARVSGAGGVATFHVADRLYNRLLANPAFMTLLAATRDRHHMEGLALLPTERIDVYRTPADPRFRFERFYDSLSQRGYVIYPGKLTVADSFRVRCIGRLDEGEIRGALDAMRGPEGDGCGGLPASGAGTDSRLPSHIALTTASAYAHASRGASEGGAPPFRPPWAAVGLLLRAEYGPVADHDVSGRRGAGIGVGGGLRRRRLGVNGGLAGRALVQRHHHRDRAEPGRAGLVRDLHDHQVDTAVSAARALRSEPEGAHADVLRVGRVRRFVGRLVVLVTEDGYREARRRRTHPIAGDGGQADVHQVVVRR